MEKKGLIFQPDGEFGWMMSHAQVPTVYVMEDKIRVFFSTRNAAGKSLTACIDLDKSNPSVIKQLYEQPVLGFGTPGTFDDEGVMPGFVIKENNQLRLYYSGWNQRGVVPYHNAMGVVFSDDDGLNFSREFHGPVMDRIATEPYIAVTPSVLKEGDEWKMWYVSGTKWLLVDQVYEPVYVVKYAHSSDGIHWQRPNISCIPQQHEHEAIAHPCVLKQNDVYHMWYCYRDSYAFRDGEGSYRIGYSQSFDGITWIRKDSETGIDVSAEGWDANMICYPYVVEVDGQLMMFYNGNGFGRSGFGYAIWE